jgi:hypothetical protein
MPNENPWNALSDIRTIGPEREMTVPAPLLSQLYHYLRGTEAPRVPLSEAAMGLTSGPFRRLRPGGGGLDPKNVTRPWTEIYDIWGTNKKKYTPKSWLNPNEYEMAPVSDEERQALFRLLGMD